MSEINAAPKTQSIRALLLAGIIPVIVFTVVEEYYGTTWGLLCGMVFGVGEIIYEKVKNGKVEAMTWGGNALLLVLGGVSLLTTDGIWFKLQPALLEAVMAVILIGSVLLGKPFLLLMAQKQKALPPPESPATPLIIAAYKGLTFRIGLFFLAHTVLAVWAALHWSTRNWALLKGVGFTASLFAYIFIEAILLRRRIRKSLLPQAAQPT